jgi:hypothetical protein
MIDSARGCARLADQLLPGLQVDKPLPSHALKESRTSSRACSSCGRVTRGRSFAPVVDDEGAILGEASPEDFTDV